MAKPRFEGEWKLWLALGVFAVFVVGYLYFVSRPPMEGGEYLLNVTKVSDNCELTLKGSGNTIEFRLIGLRIPQGQEKTVQEFLTKNLLDQWVRIKKFREDSKKTQEGLVYLSGDDMLARLIRLGLAETDRSETAFDVRTYLELEQEAKKQGRGIWSR